LMTPNNFLCLRS